MKKTAKEIQQDFYAVLRDSTLASYVGGSVYHATLRPRDSRAEDITLQWASGDPSQMQRGTLAVCVYVPDIDPYGNGVFVENMERTAAIEAKARDWFEDHLQEDINKHDNYYVSMHGVIRTMEEPATRQHFVSLMIDYKLLDND